MLNLVNDFFRRNILWFFYFYYSLALAQFTDNFSTGELHPRWKGDREDFVLTAQDQLRLNAEAAGSSALYASYEREDSMIWEIGFSMLFDPSATNKLRLYLYAEGENLEEGEALFVEVGENGNEDDLNFYHRSGNTVQLLARAEGGNLARNPAGARLHIRWREGRIWEVYCDYKGEREFQRILHFELEKEPKKALLMGLQCFYTSTRRNLFFFEEISVGPFVEDLSPPVLFNFSIEDPQQICMHFSKPMDSTLLDTHYVLLGENKIPTLLLKPVGQRSICAFFEESLVNDREYILALKGFKDTLGLSLRDTQVVFYHLIGEMAQLGEVIISEIMARPNPPVNLPNAEYIEIYNRSDKFIDLNRLYLQKGNTLYPLPSKEFLAPGHFLLLTRAINAPEFFWLSNLVPMPTFPSIADNGDQLGLVNSEGECIYQASFTSADYRNSDKSSGGWSLELSSLQQPCYSTYWQASQAFNGGTPGEKNSGSDVFLEEKSIVGFSVEQDALTLTFGQLLSPSELNSPDLWALKPQGEILGIEYSPCSPDFSECKILCSPLSPGLSYSMIWKGEVKDCASSPLKVDEILSFQLPEFPQIGELLINEILHHPKPGGRSYLEIFNNSDKYFTTGNLGLKNQSDGIIRIQENRLIPPKSYFVFSPDRENTLENHSIARPDWLLQTALPSLPNAGGSIVLLGFLPGEKVVRLDSVPYQASWHSDLLTNRAGIALERIHYEGSSLSSHNWHSAAWARGGGTPTAKNSQAGTPDLHQEEKVRVYPKVFSPDGDGYDDFLSIEIRLQGNFTITVKVYDLLGREVKTLVNNQIAGNGDLYTWDGSNAFGNRSALGSYVILLKIVDHSSRKVHWEKHSCILGGRGRD
jgi:hypothetical protein